MLQGIKHIWHLPAGNLESIPMSEESQREAVFACLLDVIEESDDSEAPYAVIVPYNFIELTTQKAQDLLPRGHVYTIKLWLLRQVNSNQ